MSPAREEILRKVRRALTRAAPAAQRLERDHYTLAGVRSPATQEGVMEQFIARATETGATVLRLDSLQAVPAEVAKRAAPATAVRCSEDPCLRKLAWEAAGLQLVPDPEALARTESVVSGCLVAIAETGSIVLSTASPNSPLCNLTAAEHIVVVRAAQIVSTIEEGWYSLDESVRNSSRAVVFVTGASRTGDIEQKLEMGVHGALALCVLLV